MSEFGKTIVMFVACMLIGVAAMGLGYNLGVEEGELMSEVRAAVAIEKGYAERIDGVFTWKYKHVVVNEYLTTTEAPKFEEPCCPGGVCPIPSLLPLPIPPRPEKTND